MDTTAAADEEADLLEQMSLLGHPESEKERLTPRRARCYLTIAPQLATLIQMLRALRAPQNKTTVAKHLRCWGFDISNAKTHRVSPPRPYVFNQEVTFFEILDEPGHDSPF